MGGLRGVYLYYGYKIKEIELRGLYETSYMRNEISKYDHEDEYEYEFEPYSFRQYLNRLFAKLDAKDIVATTLPCCTYKENGFWIIGKKIANINGFDMVPVKLSTSDDLKKIDYVLEKLLADSRLSKIISNDMIPSIYAIGDDCTSCT